MSDVTRLIEAAQAGDRQAASDLLPLVYDELRKLAAVRMSAEASGQTLDATALVHEAYLRLVGAQQFEGRGHFFAAAAEAMRRILVDSARRKKTEKHGGGRQRVDLCNLSADAVEPDIEAVLALDEALNKLASEDGVAARVVELRHFAGLGHEQVSESLNISVYEARQKWIYARAWLRDALGD